MPIYTPTELGKLIGKPRQFIYIYKKRGKVFLNEDGNFDTEVTGNKSWYNHWRSLYIENRAETADLEPKSETITIKKADPKPQKIKSILKSVQQSPDQATIDFDNSEQSVFAQKQQAELDLKLLSIKKVQIEIDQKEGKLLNIDVAKNMVAAYTSAYAKGLFRDLETWMYKMMDIHKIPLTEKTKYTSDLERIMNNATERTQKELIEKLSTENAQL